MKQATIGMLFCLLTLTLPALAQTPDTTSAWRYLPLEVGNEWRLAGTFDGEAYYERRAVTADTTIEGERYFRYEWWETDAQGAPAGPHAVDYLRFDTLSTEIRLLGEEEFPATGLVAGCPIGADFGSILTCNGFCDTGVSGSYGQTVAIRDDAVVTSIKTFDTSGCEVIGSLAAGIGLTGYVTMYGLIDLHYARVGDVEYGEPFPVATEGAPQQSTVALAVSPNPSREGATVRFSLDTPQRVTLTVYDVLGRRVLSRDLGVQPSGETAQRLDVAGLPTGVYVVRLAGDAGARATAQIVRQ